MDLNSELRAQIEGIRASGLYREFRRIESAQGPEIVWRGMRMTNFSSNDYLGLANHPALRSAAVEAVGRYGAGAGAARLISGSLSPHVELEETLAEFKGTAAAVAFNTGYLAALGTMTSLVGASDVVAIDKRAHACIVDAARLSGAKMRVFAHNDMDALESILKWAAMRRLGVGSGSGAAPAQATAKGRVLIVTESVFSMDGDHAPLKELVELKDRYGAWLMVDEAHATGLYGENGRGLSEALGIADRIDVQMGTLGKAIGASGGYIAGSRTLVEFLVNRARTFLFSTAPVPAAVAAATAGLRVVRSEEGRRRREALWTRVSQFRARVESGGIPAMVADLFAIEGGGAGLSPICPVILGDERKAVEIGARLMDQGFYLPAVRYPTVPRGEARLRLSFTADHTEAHVEALAGALAGLEIRPRRMQARKRA